MQEGWSQRTQHRWRNVEERENAGWSGSSTHKKKETGKEELTRLARRVRRMEGADETHSEQEGWSQPDSTPGGLKFNEIQIKNTGRKQTLVGGYYDRAQRNNGADRSELLVHILCNSSMRIDGDYHRELHGIKIKNSLKEDAILQV